MKLSELFLAAKAHLAMTPDEEIDGKTEFICHALARAAKDDLPLLRKACNIVSGRLGHSSTVTMWLRNELCIEEEQLDEGYPRRSVDDYYARPRVQQFRAAWLDHLAAEFAAKGE